MKISEIPDEALSAPATPVPTKTVYDWESMLAVIKRRGFVIIESDNIRTTTIGAEECVLVKMFNSYVRTTKGLRLRTKRISKNRWYCAL